MRWDYPPLDINPLFPGLGDYCYYYYYYYYYYYFERILPLGISVLPTIYHGVYYTNKIIDTNFEIHAHYACWLSPIYSFYYFYFIFFCALRGSFSERTNVHAGSNLFQNLFNFAISQIEISKEFWGCFQRKTPKPEKELILTTGILVVRLKVYIDGLKVYLEYIE